MDRRFPAGPGTSVPFLGPAQTVFVISHNHFLVLSILSFILPVCIYSKRGRYYEKMTIYTIM